MWPVWLGTGFGAGRAWEEADGQFKARHAMALGSLTLTHFNF